MGTIWCGVVLVALAACDAGAPTCKDAVANAVKKGAPMAGDEQTILTQSCEARKWSGDVRGCLSRASSQAALTSCLKPVLVDFEAATAEAAFRRASADAKAAAGEVEVLEAQRDTNVKEVEAAVNAVVSSTSDAERSAASAKLTAARTRQADIQALLAAAITKATAAERAKAVHVSPECLENPLAAGCQ